MVKSRVGAQGRHPVAAPLSALMLAAVLAGLLGGCNTTAGFGEDMQSAGKGIEHSADKNK